jgi:hypothetical protein
MFAVLEKNWQVYISKCCCLSGNPDECENLSSILDVKSVVHLPQPYDTARAFCVDVPHHSDLSCSFIIICLVDAQLVNPDCAFHGGLTEARKGSVEVMGDLETMSRNRDLSLSGPITPHVAQSLKVFVAVQANDSDFTLYFDGLNSRQQFEDPYLTISGSMHVCHFQPNLEIDVNQLPTKKWESILHAISWTAFL